MQETTLDAKAGEVSAELVRRSVAADARVHALAEVVGEDADLPSMAAVVGEDADLPSMAAVAEAGCAFRLARGRASLLHRRPDLMRPPRQRAGWVFASGRIALTRFPFTDPSGHKRRPALVVSRDEHRRADLVVCFVTSVPRPGPDWRQSRPLSAPASRSRP
jgi:hypothetical protein